MIARLRALFGGPVAGAPSDLDGRGDAAAANRLHAQMGVLNSDPYLHVVTEDRLVSVFDDLRYDRADADWMSQAMRMHAIGKLKPLGFGQTSGTVLENREAGVRLHIPKFHAQGASPFDITRYTPKREQDYYLLTPTQVACRFIDTYGRDEAVERIKTLIAKHPVNLYRLLDYLERKPAHRAFAEAFGHLKYVQREAIASEPLCRRRALG